MPPTATHSRAIMAWMCCQCKRVYPLHEGICSSTTCLHLRRRCGNCVVFEQARLFPTEPAMPAVPKDGELKNKNLLEEAHPHVAPEGKSPEEKSSVVDEEQKDDKKGKAKEV